jgi:hypothetical protein
MSPKLAQLQEQADEAEQCEERHGVSEPSAKIFRQREKSAYIFKQAVKHFKSYFLEGFTIYSAIDIILLDQQNFVHLFRKDIGSQQPSNASPNHNNVRR